MHGQDIVTPSVSQRALKKVGKFIFSAFSAPEKKFEALTSKQESMAWIWAIVISFSVPEIGAFMRSARLCFFKSFRSFRLYEFGLVCFIEISYVIGLSILAFKVLPSVDVVQGAMLTNCLCLIPGILGIFASLFFE